MTTTATKSQPDIFDILWALPKPLDVVIEIGAADGGDSGAIWAATQAKDYYAIEPDKRNLNILYESSMYGENNFRVFEYAVGDKDGFADFNPSNGHNTNLDREHTFSGSLKKPKEHLIAHPWCIFGEPIQVRTIRLDTFVEFYGIPFIDLIWCDVQGAEDLVIAGGQKSLAKTTYFYTEYYQNEMYEGQISCEEIHKRLPGEWKIIERWAENVLFKNIT